MMLQTRAGIAAASFNHLVGTGKQGGRHREPHRLCGVQIEKQLSFRRLLDRQLRRLFSFEYPSGVDARLSVCISETTSVGHQAPIDNELANHMDRWYLPALCHGGELSRLAVEQRVSTDDETGGLRFGNSREC